TDSPYSAPFHFVGLHRPLFTTSCCCCGASSHACIANWISALVNLAACTQQHGTTRNHECEYTQKEREMTLEESEAREQGLTLRVYRLQQRLRRLPINLAVRACGRYGMESANA